MRQEVICGVKSTTGHRASGELLLNHLVVCDCINQSWNQFVQFILSTSNARMGWFSQGYPGHTKLIFISLFVSQLCANYIVVQRWILPRDIVRELPFRTVTSCIMECRGTDKCKAGGFLKDPEELFINGMENKKCLLLKLVRNKNKNGTRNKVYALLDVTKLFSFVFKHISCKLKYTS